MKQLWLVKEPCYVWYNTKPIHEVLGTNKVSYAVEIELSEKEFDQYQDVLNKFNHWQEVFEKKVNSE